MSSRYPDYPRPSLYAENPPKEYTKADRRVKRYTDCTECREKDPNYSGCNHPEEADEVHPSGGPAIGRVDNENPKDPDTDNSKAGGFSDLDLDDLFAGVCYPTYTSWLQDICKEENVPESLRVELTKVDHRFVRSSITESLEQKIMLRVQALNNTLFMNIDETAKSIVLFTTHGLLISGASDKRTHYGNLKLKLDPKTVACALALTYRSSTATIERGYNILYPTGGKTAVTNNAEANTENLRYASTDHIKKLEFHKMDLPSLPLPILHQELFAGNGDVSPKKIRRLVVVCKTQAAAIEYLREGLFVGVMGFTLDESLLSDVVETSSTRDQNSNTNDQNSSIRDQNSSTSDQNSATPREENQAVRRPRTAKDDERDRLLGELEEWTGNFATYLRQELKNFRMEISK